MSQYEKEIYQNNYTNFNNACKRVEVYKSQNRKLTSNLEKISDYKTSISKTFNAHVEYISQIIASLDKESQIQVKEEIQTAVDRVNECLEILHCEYVWPASIYPTIVESDITETQSTDLISASEQASKTVRNSNRATSNKKSQTTDNMVQSAPEFLKTAASILNYKFNGDPLKLEAFLADVDLVESVAEDNNKDLCLKYIKAKLEAKALECMPDEIESVDDIVEALRAHIKPENSKVVEGKMLALRLKKGDFSEFSEEAEKLAESLKRTLVIEGISKAKAQEMTIAKTVELCRKTARSEIVKSVLSAKSFATPAEVIANFVTENTIARNEQRESEMFKNKRHFGDKRSPSKQWPQRANNSQQRSNFDNRNNVRRPHGPQNNRRFNDRPNFGNNNGNFNQNRFNNNRFQNNNGRQNRNEHTIRVVTGSAGTSSQDNGNQANEQVFRIPM